MARGQHHSAQSFQYNYDALCILRSESDYVADPTDEKLYLLVAKELSINKRDEALWTMAFALENGDEAKTKAHYIRLRVAQLISDRSKTNTSAKATDGSPNTQPPSPPQPAISVCWQRTGDLPNPDQQDLLSEYTAVVGERNLDYYLSRFAAFDKQGAGLHLSWNWPAFLFNVPWAIYRKLYGWGIGLALLLATIDGLLGKHAPLAAIVLTLVVLLPFGLFANSLYWEKCKSKIQQARSTTRDEQRALMDMRQTGGVLGWMPKVAITLAVVVPVLGIFLSILFPKVSEKKAPQTPPPSASSKEENPLDKYVIPGQKPPWDVDLSSVPYRQDAVTEFVGHWTCAGRRGNVDRQFIYTLNSDGTMHQAPLDGNTYESPVRWQITGLDGPKYLETAYASREGWVGRFMIQSITGSTLSMRSDDGLSVIECSR